VRATTFDIDAYVQQKLRAPEIVEYDAEK